ncbi:cysteine hydrolase [Sulfitobacter mediterraneus]|uniref:cysteine hydrolase family protein n=1 Tax=Sulfitobacter mediterraneus TaxID=83219 RepID=UPI00193A134D|nr:isochorismatase family cysteine hydrolase [Sulfitobacter mediterraneus]MBM1556329.1 cysteine hydrolase [Sulfitobacter mediterraneus]MBM1567633.1 cysteine hydrolase [Sulfitobacter mediterraneus]MBM1571683.1 cysteine hydrolase [Sulfitobacter mediterraneus]MBM1575471.1 cysteine hydrolase [Sulfitobacter mediterraneus]MBM1579038.1 cysteine hydrolase [Sulfitobacter mediterraneus]
MTGFLFALVIGGLAFWFARGVWLIGRVSSGPKVQNQSATALVMIDLQTVFWRDGPYSPDQKAGAETAILQAVERAKSHGIPVIALRQEWSIPATKVIARLAMKGAAVAGTEGTEIAPPFAGKADHTLVKRVQDGFETGALDPLLKKLGVGHLHLMGLDTAYCVAKTALAARARGYRVTIDRRSILAADQKTADKALKQLEDNGVTLI